jgi:predicted Mrr-cat superfamily restriction endonuclease
MTTYRIRLGNLPEDGCGDLWPRCSEDECVAIGWGELGDLKLYTTKGIIDYQKLWNGLIQNYPTMSKRVVGKSITQIKIFYNDCTKDDVIIAYFKGQICGIGRVGDYYFNDDARYRIEMISPQTHEKLLVLFYQKRKVDWVVNYDSPLKVRNIFLSQHLRNKLNTQPTIIELTTNEWNELRHTLDITL